MNLLNHPKLLDHLASTHALGTLRGGARRRFETLALRHEAVRAAAQAWQARLAGLNEIQDAVPAPAPVWTRIDSLLNAEREQQRLLKQEAEAQARIEASVFTGGWWRNAVLWRTLTLGGTLAVLLALSTGMSLYEQMNAHIQNLTTQLQKMSPVEYVAVLQDAQGRTIALATFDPRKKQVKVQRVGNYQEAADHSLQLWALPAQGNPRSLGVLGNARLERLPPLPDTTLTDVTTLAISLEPKGGVSGEQGPTGPVLFKGAWVRNLL
jgi:anti-sigma-K factor RskA